MVAPRGVLLGTAPVASMSLGQVRRGEIARARRGVATICLVLLVSRPGFALHDPDQPPDGLRVGTITIVAAEVFDEDRERLSGPYAVANKVHIRTRDRVVERELLFTTGQPFSREIVEQTERNLRALPFLRDARIETTLVDEDGDGEADRADVRVRTWDAWSLSPRLDFSSIGDRSVYEVGVGERNFLGLGKQISASRRQMLDRTSNRLLYRDPQLAGSRFALTTSIASLTDGGEGIFTLARPFFSLQDRWAVAVRAGGFARNDPLIAGGETVGQLRHLGRWADVELARAVRRRPTQALRLHAAYRLRHEDVGPERREYGIVEVGIGAIEHDFVQLTHVNRFERPEDFNLGTQTFATFGVSTAPLGGRDGTVLFLAAEYTRGAALGEAHFLTGRFRVTARQEEDALRNALIEADVRYLKKHTLRHALIGTIDFRHGHRLDPEVQVRLGAESGLRGYPVRQFVGTRSLLLSAEERWFIADDVGQLVSLGVAGFIDSGFAWAEGNAVDLGDLRTAIGVSLLLGANRLSARPGIRLDLAYALDPMDDVGRWVLVSGSDIRF